MTYGDVGENDLQHSFSLFSNLHVLDMLIWISYHRLISVSVVFIWGSFESIW
jgi:hypothetical protein